MAKSKSRAAAATKASSKASSTKKRGPGRPPGSSKKKANSSKKKAPPPTKKAAPSTKQRFLTCPESGERVFVGTATLADIKNPPASQKKKILFKIPSAKTRQDLYDELALCLEDKESRLLPKYGGRPWSVVCKVNDNSAKASSPFFRWFRGHLELAVLPHLLEKIPDPPKFPGYIQTEQGVRRQIVKDEDDDDEDDEEEAEEEYENMTEEEVQRMESLVGRDISTLSQVAWDHRNDSRLGAPLPTISIKWTCPLRQTFTSRKAAWDHARELAKAEQFIDRFLHGRGKNGTTLKPFRPTRPQSLQAGKVRFLRDGLWVVGQEQNWQNERYRKMYEKEQQQKPEAVESADIVTSMAMAEPPKKRKRITGLSLFVSLHREAHRDARFKELTAEAKKASKNKPTKKENIDNPVPEVVLSKTAAKVGLPTPPPVKPTKPKKTGQVKFSLFDAERELRAQWKQDLSKEQRESWEAKAETCWQRKLEDDDNLRWKLWQQQQKEEETSDEDVDDEEEEEETSDEDVDDEESTSDEDVDDEVEAISDVHVDEEEETTSDEDEAEKRDREVNEGAAVVEEDSNEGDEAEKAAEKKVEVASDKKRSIWEIFAEKELDFWKVAAKKRKNAGDTTSSAHRFESFISCRQKVFHKRLGDTPEQYEQRALRNAKGNAAERQKRRDEQKRGKELLAQGMYKRTVEADEILKRQTKDWVVKTALPKTASKPETASRNATTATTVDNHQRTAIKSSPHPPKAASKPEAGFRKAVAVTVDNHQHASLKSSPDPPGEKFDGEAEVETVRHLPKKRAATTAMQPSTPVSPSPILGEPIGATPSRAGSMVQEVTTPADDNNVLANTFNEESVQLSIRKSRERAEAEAKLKEEDKEQSDAEETVEEAEEEEEEEEVPFFVPTANHCLSEKQINLCKDACMDHFDAVMRTVKAKDLTRELVDGFDLLRERGRGRYDMELPVFETPKFDFLNNINKAPWMPIVKQVLGDDVVLIHKGVFLSLPEAKNQNYHQDGLHLLTTSQKPCHAVNVFVPLVDMTMQHGPTEFCLGSHVLGQEDWDRRYLAIPLPKKGVPVMFDYRLGHRGLANTSKESRPIVYCTYARARDGKEFRDSVNFSRKRYRKLGEIVEKPMSREERKQKRQEIQAAAYDEFWATR